MERSVDGGRIREFSADELVAFARGFDLPIGWFLTPPPVDDGIDIAVPDAKRGGLDPAVLLDLVLGTPETVEAWRRGAAHLAICLQHDAHRSQRSR